jgi:hypothetical protein
MDGASPSRSRAPDGELAGPSRAGGRAAATAPFRGEVERRARARGRAWPREGPRSTSSSGIPRKGTTAVALGLLPSSREHAQVRAAQEAGGPRAGFAERSTAEPGARAIRAGARSGVRGAARRAVRTSVFAGAGRSAARSGPEIRAARGSSERGRTAWTGDGERDPRSAFSSVPVSKSQSSASCPRCDRAPAHTGEAGRRGPGTARAARLRATTARASSVPGAGLAPQPRRAAASARNASAWAAIPDRDGGRGRRAGEDDDIGTRRHSTIPAGRLEPWTRRAEKEESAARDRSPPVEWRFALDFRPGVPKDDAPRDPRA